MDDRERPSIPVLLTEVFRPMAIALSVLLAPALFVWAVNEIGFISILGYPILLVLGGTALILSVRWLADHTNP